MMHNTGIKSGSAATGALSVTEPQPVWMTLDEARERAFTGEIVFEVDPEVLAYLDHGVVYYAERASDEPLGRRLLDAGVVDTTQLERGTVRVGDVEHLGRLFDRDTSVDRDAVLVVTETSTEDLIADLANRAVTTVRVTAYRHHPSGVHRWFATPLDVLPPARPVAQLDHVVIEEVPGLAIPTHPGIEDLSIEWDDITDMPSDDHVSISIDEFELVLFDSFRESEMPVDSHAGVEVDVDPDADPEVIELALDMAAYTDTAFSETAFSETAFTDTGAAASFSVEGSDDSTTTYGTPADDTADDTAGDTAGDTADDMADEMDDFEFQVVWPDGSEESVTTATADAALVGVPAVADAADGELRFDMPALEPVDDDDASDALPDDVAAAVRRAIAAIESASTEAASLAPIDIDPEIATTSVPVAAQITTQVPTVPALPTVPASLGGFAPPTLDMAAEAIYAREAAAIEAADAVLLNEQPRVASPPSAEATPIAETAPVNRGVASVVFINDEPVADAGDDNDRSSALRRLIGSLRRKDH